MTESVDEYRWLKLFAAPPSADSFPFLKLPEVPRERVLKHLKPVDLFELSLVSRQMAELVRSLRIESEIQVTCNRGLQMIAVSFPGLPQSSIWWDFSPFSQDFKEERTVGGIRFLNCQKFQQSMMGLNEYFCNYDNIEQGLAVVVAHLDFVFPATLSIQCAPQAIRGLGEFFSYPNFKHWQSMDLCGSVPLSADDVRRIFDNVTVEQTLEISMGTSDEVPILQALEVESLKLVDARWMVRDHLLRLNCRVADLRSHRFTLKDLEAFGRSWQQGGAANLERISFGWDASIPIVFEDLETSPWQSEEREKTFVYAEETGRYAGTVMRIDCEEGVDLKRHEDGQLATFVIENGASSSLSFFVWEDRFPELMRREALPFLLAPYYQRLEELSREYTDSTSLERLLANPTLRYDEFVRTYRILRNMDGEYRPFSMGRTRRRTVFDQMYDAIGVHDVPL